MYINHEPTPNRIVARVLTPDGYSKPVKAFFTGEKTAFGNGYYEGEDRRFILKYEWDDQPTLVEMY